MSTYIDEIARAVRRDQALKARILAIAPGFAMDQEMGDSAASGRELAARMLRALGITYDSGDSVERMAEAWIQGAQWGAARNHMNGPYSGPTADVTKIPGNRPDRPNNKLIGEPGWREERASMDGDIESSLDRYLAQTSV